MKVLIVGLGSIARKHLTALKEIKPGSTVYALRSSLNVKREDGIKNIFNWQEALDSGPYDFAIISNPTSEHKETIEKLIPFNCPLFIEKPVLGNLQEAAFLENLIRENNIITYVACNLRFHPCIQYIKEYLNINNPIIQETTSYCGSYLPDWRPGKDFRTLYSAQKELGGGVHLDLIHELDYLHWLFGYPLEHVNFLNNKSELKIDAVDYAHYILSYEKFISTVTLNYFRPIPQRTFEIVTNKDVLLIDLIQSRIMKNNKEIFSSEPGFINTYTFQLKYFINAIQTNSELMNDFSEAVRTLNICIG